MMEALNNFVRQYKVAGIGIAALAFLEIYLLFHSFNVATEFPRREFAIEATNIVLRDLFLACILFLLYVL